MPGCGFQQAPRPPLEGKGWFEAKAADKVWEVAEECLTAPGAWAASSRHFPSSTRPSCLPCKQEQSDPLLRMLIGGLIWGISLHTSIAQ